jgi:hypothetical protein
VHPAPVGQSAAVGQLVFVRHESLPVRHPAPVGQSAPVRHPV